ncbi:hypothetical protein V6Z11_A06G030500 [Gossypium hirsutum]
MPIFNLETYPLLRLRRRRSTHACAGPKPTGETLVRAKNRGVPEPSRVAQMLFELPDYCVSIISPI